MKRSYIQRKTPMRRGTTRMRRTKLKPRSDKGKVIDREYLGTARPDFLSLPENEFCAFSLALEGKQVPATTVHHYRGRGPKLTNDSRFFVPACPKYDLWPHQNPTKAREIGLLCAATDWETSPKPGHGYNLPTRYKIQDGKVKPEWRAIVKLGNIKI